MGWHETVVQWQGQVRCFDHLGPVEDVKTLGLDTVVKAPKMPSVGHLNLFANCNPDMESPRTPSGGPVGEELDLLASYNPDKSYYTSTAVSGSESSTPPVSISVEVEVKSPMMPSVECEVKELDLLASYDADKSYYTSTAISGSESSTPEHSAIDLDVPWELPISQSNTSQADPPPLPPLKLAKTTFTDHELRSARSDESELAAMFSSPRSGFATNRSGFGQASEEQAAEFEGMSAEFNVSE